MTLLFSYIVIMMLMIKSYDNDNDERPLMEEVFLKELKTKVSLFSRRNLETLYIFWRISEIEVLADTEIFVF